MYLEDILGDLKKDIAKNTALLEKLAARQGGVEAPEKGDDDNKPARRTREKSEDNKPARRTREKSEDDKPKAEKGEITDKQIMATFEKFLEITDKKDLEERTDFVKTILNEVGVAKSRFIPPGDRAKVIGWLKKFLDGEKVDFSADEGDEPEDDKGSLI